MTDACNCDADPCHAVQVPCPVHDHPDLRRLADERDALKEQTVAQHRELAVLRRRNDDLAESYRRLNESMMIERRENAALSGVIARGQSSTHGWPDMPTSTFARLMLGSSGIDVAICKGDSVDALAKMIAAAMAQHERTNR